MAICKWAGNPYMFLTFTSSPKWLEVKIFLDSLPGQKPTEIPDVSRVFKVKLDQLLKDMVQGRHFGRVLAAIYTIEFQKRGLPHTHILLFLYLEDKHPSPAQIDNIISAEIRDIAINPTRYAAVTQFMICGPCSSAKCNSHANNSIK